MSVKSRSLLLNKPKVESKLGTVVQSYMSSVQFQLQLGNQYVWSIL